jgi:nucleotide-binding universal stress UspA family protein
MQGWQLVAVPALTRINARAHAGAYAGGEVLEEHAMLKSILFPVLESAPDEGPLAAACALARRHDATLTFGICVNAIPANAVSASTYPVQVYEAFSQAARQAEARLKTTLEQSLAAREVRFQVQAASSFLMGPAELATMQARYFDLVAFARSAGDNAHRERQDFATLLFGGGRPVLLLPAAMRSPAEGPALVAWKPTREASRAVHDALPLLARAPSVRVLSVAARSGEFEHGELVGADIGAALAAHGLRVETVTRPREAAGTARTLLQDAREQGASLLVAGGYGHHRVRELLFGGTTRELFDEATLPVLFSR